MANKTSDNKITKDQFIHEIADRAYFTIGDVKIIWDTIEDILKDIIYHEKELVIPGLFKLFVRTIPEHEGYDIKNNTGKTLPESKRIYFKTSVALKNLFKDSKEENSSGK